MRDAVVDAAMRFRPNASAPDVVPLGEGQLSVAALVDGYVVRVPRSAFARKHLLHEVEVVQWIAPRLRHSLPTFVAVELDGPNAFVAHRYLAGTPLTSESVEEMPSALLANVAAATATFLRDLHSLDVDAFRSLRSASNAEFADALRDEVLQLLRPRMSDQARRRAESELDGLARVTTRRFAVCHTDIGGNVLTDADGSVAFIDFGSVMIGDPVLDFASLSVLGPRFLAECALTYPEIGERPDDIRVVRATFHLQDALYGARQGDWTYVDDVLSSYV